MVLRCQGLYFRHHISSLFVPSNQIKFDRGETLYKYTFAEGAHTHTRTHTTDTHARMHAHTTIQCHAIASDKSILCGISFTFVTLKHIVFMYTHHIYLLLSSLSMSRSMCVFRVDSEFRSVYSTPRVHAHTLFIDVLSIER